MPNGKKSSHQDRQFNKAGDAPDGTQNGSAEQRTTAELSARAAQRLSVLGEMTSGIAHDFRNILAVIDCGLRLAESNSNDSVCTFLAGAREGVDRGLTLTSRLLTFAKHREFQARAVDVNELLKALELFLRYGAG